ncbi:MAG: hypothetical protein GXO65_07770 [Euryarchaeota archaeon]|nr:hypothetical protein [Euryarchaeota archaeon]
MAEVEGEVRLEEGEPWEPIETKLVVYSLALGVVALVVLGAIINKYILSLY